MPDDIEVRLLPLQYEFLTSELEWAAARGGVGSGKTMAMVWWMIQRLEDYPLATHVVVGADYEQLRRGFFSSLLDVIEEDIGLVRGEDFTYRDNPTPMIRMLHSGARIRAMSAEIAQRVRSIEIQTLYCEEPQTWHEGSGAATFKAIADRLRFSRSATANYPTMALRGRMTFNPPSMGSWLYELIEKRWPAAGYKCWRFSLRDNVLLLDQAGYIRRVEANHPPEEWATEIDGHWSTLGGSVYRGYNPEIHNVDPIGRVPARAWDESRPIIWSHDFNISKMCSVIGQVYAQDRIIRRMVPQSTAPPKPEYGPEVAGYQERLVYILDEIVLREKGTPDVLREFLLRHGERAKRMGVVLYGDASGSNRAQTMSSQEAAQSNWEILILGLRNAGIPVSMQIPMSNPSVVDRIVNTRLQFHNNDGPGFFVLADKCPELINDILSVNFLEGKNEIDKRDPERTHMTDAFSYLCWADRQRGRYQLKTFFNSR